jgi:subtilase family protein
MRAGKARPWAGPREIRVGTKGSEGVFRAGICDAYETAAPGRLLPTPIAQDGAAPSPGLKALPLNPAALLQVLQQSGVVGPEGARAPLILLIDPEKLEGSLLDPDKAPPGVTIPPESLQQMVMLEAPKRRGKACAADEIVRFEAPAADHPLMRYVAQIRDALKAQGLASDAEGVKILAVGENPYDPDPNVQSHGGNIARTIGGPCGLARGAVVKLFDPAIKSFPPERTAPYFQVLDLARAKRLAGGHATMEDAFEAGVGRVIAEQIRYRLEVEKAIEMLPIPEDKRTRIVSFSSGISVLRLAQQLVTEIGRTPPQSRIKVDAEAWFGRKIANNADVLALRDAIAAELLARIEKPKVKARIKKEQAELTETVRRARESRIAIFASCGNDYAVGASEALTTHVTAGIRGITLVGATAIHDPNSRAADRMADFSNPGAHLSAPGVKWPVAPPPNGEGPPADTDGTSYSGPFVASVAALMIAENPAISPEQIEAGLLESARHVPGAGVARDGAGMIDPVAAVAYARAAK